MLPKQDLIEGMASIIVPKLVGKKDYTFWRTQMETQLQVLNLNRFVQEIEKDADANIKRRESLICKNFPMFKMSHTMIFLFLSRDNFTNFL